MINTIIFDFGDIFINLNKEAIVTEFTKLGLKEWYPDLDELNKQFEVGKVSEQEFLNGFLKHLPNNVSLQQIRDAWNSILGDFPLERLEFLQSLKGKFRMFLLTNTDEIHIDRFEHMVGLSFSRDFYNCFEKVYYSYELKMRKPNDEIFRYLISKHELFSKKIISL